MHLKHRFALLLLLLVSIAGMHNKAFAQTLTNVDFTTNGDKIEISYDLLDCPLGETYDIDVFLITKTDRNTRTKLTNGLTGDLTGIEGGSGKHILYDVLADRDQLDGTVQFEVRIGKTHRVKEQLWKKDKGYFGVTIGGFKPNFSGPLSLGNGVFFQMAYGHTNSNVLGLSYDYYFYTTSSKGNSWFCTGFSIGPLVSIPLGEKIKWDIRPQVGLAMSNLSDTNSSLSDFQYGYNLLIGTGLRFNLGKYTSWMVGYDYLGAVHKFGSTNTSTADTSVGAHGYSVGVAFRLFR